MKYLLLIYEREELFEGKTAGQQKEIIGRYFQVNEDLQRTGRLMAGEALQPVATASTVRVREGKTMVTDGPFAETREQLGGFYLIQAEHLDEALAAAARLPGAQTGGVEVRPVVEFGQEN